MKTRLFFVILWMIPLSVWAQDSVLARMLFIGDAGEMDHPQAVLIRDAARQVIPGRTTVLFLGDNIYPRGMGLSGTPEEDAGKRILQSQFLPMRQQGAAVYFVPGNHDWDKMGPQGLAKVQAAWRYIQDQQDSLLGMWPKDGCPDPAVIPVTDSLIIVAMDSEWWLFPYNKDASGADCDCSSTRDVIDALREILYENRDKVIILAMHHPFYSYAVHGGRFTWKDHLFPLTVVNPHLYIPLPGIGSIYPLYRKGFPNREDLHNPLYQEMIKDVLKVFQGFPNLVLAAGHDHGMQLIRPPEGAPLQIVSGGGSKHTSVGKGKYSLFHAATQGYVVVDLLAGKRLRIDYHTYGEDTMHDAYTTHWEAQSYLKHIDSMAKAIGGDSVVARAHPAYGRPGQFSRMWFGNNYRDAWSEAVKLPVLRISELHGGLTPEKLGGGFQSTSLRLKDKDGAEYILRSVEKSPDKVLPEAFQGTFMRQLIDDATSAQHPYSALIIPPFAHALDIPHATPIIGVVSPDTALGMYQKLFAGKVTLFEAREPLGNTDNYIKALDKLHDDNDNSYDALNFLRARMLDLLVGDWDRHGDQWRFYDEKKGSGKYYIAIPRDRDMVLNLTEGILPSVLKRNFLMPHVPGFRKNMLTGAKYYLYKTRFLSADPASQIGYEDWMQQATWFTHYVTDSVIDAALRRLPARIYQEEHEHLAAILETRRDQMEEAMRRYYTFSNRIVDIRTSKKNEWVNITGSPDSNALRVFIRKISKHGKLEDTLMDKTYPRSLTLEIRLYLSGGDDSVVVDNPSSSVGLRIIGGKGHKAYNIVASRRSIRLYDREKESYYGESGRLKKRLRDDSAHTAFVRTNLYSTAIPLITGSINADDGLSLGVGVQYKHQLGFRKSPYASMHQLMFSHSFSTDAFRFVLKNEWIHALGRADILLNGDIKAPNNTQNFFGQGNTTPFVKEGDYKRYYRTRFNLFTLQSALRWRGAKGSAFSVGPALEYYHMDQTENKGRFIEQTSFIHSYDSATLYQDKAHLGLDVHYSLDQRNQPNFPTYGVWVDIHLQGFTGLNDYSRSFARLTPQLALYKSLNTRQTLVLADRIGGGITLGAPAFYQSLFLGGEGTLLGYRKYRFAGEKSLYNNMELRLALSNFGNYIFKGQLGLAGFYDVGRVWQSGETSQKWHQGVGAGIYFIPAYMAVFRLYVGHSSEGWYPYVNMGFRF